VKAIIMQRCEIIRYILTYSQIQFHYQTSTTEIQRQFFHFQQASSTTMSLTKPTFVLVPGSFSPPSWYEKVTPFLEKAGYENVVVPLPSANSEGKYKTPPTMTDDAASIKAVISDLVNNGKEVIIVMHSYGGYPGTEATGGLAKADRQKQGKDGGVVALVYVAGWMPPVGKSIFELQGEPEMLKNAVSFGPPFSISISSPNFLKKRREIILPSLKIIQLFAGMVF
jgi:pimeloyl-ACP methyl ester carboxylesterase